MAVNNTDRRLAPDVTIDYTEGMTSEPYKPAGYCPHCGYAIDPGTCPECGRTSSAARLHRVPYWLKRRYTIKRIAKVAMITSLLLGGWYFCFCVQWERWLPTSALLRLQGDATNRMTRELMRRFSNGSLTGEETKRLFTQAIRKPDHLDLRSPWPASVRIPVETSVRLELEGLHCYWSGSARPLAVDGRRPDNGWDDVDGDLRMGSSGSSGIFSILTEQLLPGYHELSLTVSWDVSISQPRPGYRLSGITSTASGRLLVEDKPVTDYVKPVWSPQIARDLEVKLRAVIIRGTDGYLSLRVQSAALPVNLAGRFSFPMGSDAMQRLALDRPVTSKRQPAHWAGEWNLLRVMHVDYIPETCDVQFSPDPVLALLENCEDFFDGVIIWSKCPVTATESGASPDYLGASAVLPTRVFRLGEAKPRSTRPGS